jgi:acetyl-CoA carboxylase/biotin carboxylase 1
MRKGIIVLVQYLDEAEEYLQRALEVFSLAGSRKKRPSANGLLLELNGKHKIPQRRLENNDELGAVCNVAIRYTESSDDTETLARIKAIVKDYKEGLLNCHIRRLTFICGHKDGSYLGYFTFRGLSYEEDDSIRHIEPALAFHLELGRLSKFKVKPSLRTETFTFTRLLVRMSKSDKPYFTRAVVRVVFWYASRPCAARPD